MTSRNRVRLTLVGGLAIGALTLAGCSSNSATDAASSAAGAAGDAASSAAGAASEAASQASSDIASAASAADGATADAAFCQSVSQLVNSGAGQQLAAAEDADNPQQAAAAIKAAAPQFKAFVATLPVDVPADIKGNLETYAAQIEQFAASGQISQADLAKLKQAGDQVDNYVESTCGITPNNNQGAQTDDADNDN